MIFVTEIVPKISKLAVYSLLFDHLTVSCSSNSLALQYAVSSGYYKQTNMHHSLPNYSLCKRLWINQHGPLASD